MNILFLKSAWSRLTISNQFLTMMMKNAHWEHLDNFACNDKAKKSVEMPKVTIRLNRFSLGQSKYHSGISRQQSSITSLEPIHFLQMVKFSLQLLTLQKEEVFAQ